MSGEADVLQLTNTLSSEHFQQALELLGTSKKCHDPSWRPSDDESGFWPDRVSHRYALSSMMHAFAALEGHVNRIAYGILREPTFPYFVALEDRTIEFKDLVSKWDGGLSIEKKTQFLLGLRHAIYPPDLLQNLRELTSLRNWIVHGKVYRTALLIERNSDDPNSGTVRLRADDEEWSPKFPRYKFPMPDRLSYSDGKEFLIGIAETLCHLADAYTLPLLLVLGEPGSYKVLSLGGQSDVIDRLRLHIDAL